MEGDPDFPAPPAEAKFFSKPSVSRPISTNLDSFLSRSSYNTSCYSTTSSSSSSSPELVRHVQAALRRQRPLGMMQVNRIKPRRFLVPQQTAPMDLNVKPPSTFDVIKREEDIPQDARLRSSFSKTSNAVAIGGEKQEDVSIIAPTGWGSTVNSREDNFKSYNAQRDQSVPSTGYGSDSVVAPSSMEVEPGNLDQVQKKVHFAVESNAISHGDKDRVATRIDDMLSHMVSSALTELECNVSNQVDALGIINQDWQQKNFESMEVDNNLRPEGGISSPLTRSTMGNQDQVHQNDFYITMTQSSVVGSSCVTSTLINQTSDPKVTSTTYCSQPQISGANVGTEPAEVAEVQPDVVQPSYSLPKDVGVLSQYSDVISKPIDSLPATSMHVKKSSSLSNELQSHLRQECDISKATSCNDNNSLKGNVSDIKSHSLPSKVPLSDAKSENSKSEIPERGATAKTGSTSRKRGYDPDLFFKVNGKLYQRLGKIGSGGSSEVHKVISSDCTIYALKKIKLKGRDYATAYGFCQEIEYLNRLKGMNNIIQLIDYEVTDKTLHREVMNGTMSNKDGRVKDDGYIYMVLEYGEIDLAHMLSQKWKELDGSSATIDENWLRFYWQQILQAVNIIHEERIVHSDLKPANFLLVRGALKLIDFGIAKAIMSDTTNIQRDSQVGTLSYMSPEAFMCNEMDANGNTIKCGRPSDIWSLGCILYQMVYGRTPFSEYKTFWAKFKVITDPSHEIVYEPVSNPWLLDLMKKCLAWDRNERWRIPQLLQHPFLVPPVPPQLPSPLEQQSCEYFQLIAKFGKSDEKVLSLCSQLQNMIMDPRSVSKPESTVSIDLLREITRKISDAWFQLQEQLAKN